MTAAALPAGRPALGLAARDGAAIASARPGLAEAALSVRSLTVSYGEHPAVFSVDADFPAASLSAIIGPNGAGKSTLLKAALGVVPSVSGAVEVFGRRHRAADGRVAYVPQRASVDWDFPTRVLDVVLMGLHRRLGLLARVRGVHLQEARACLARVGMAEFEDRQIGMLSGGQQQRVFLARALAQDAELYLLDEPFAGVDAATERAIIDVLKGVRDAGRSVICVHHDLTTVARYFDHVLLLNVRKMAEGAVASAFTSEALAATYGGRLAEAQIDQLRLPSGGESGGGEPAPA